MSQRADFYLLDATTPQAGWQFGCRLLDKIYQQKQQALVLCQDKFTAEHIDELLWTYKDDSFVPHNLVGEGPSTPPPIQIAWENIPNHHRNNLVLLTPQLPEEHSRFRRLLLILHNDEEIRNQARDLYKQLKNEGAELHMHEV